MPSRPTSRRLTIDARGYANLARQIRSPNHDARPADTPVTLVVIHGISLPPGEFGGDGDRAAVHEPARSGVAPVLRVDRAPARLRAFLDPPRRPPPAVRRPATNAPGTPGVSRFRGRAHCNDFSIGIELEGTDEVPYETAQYAVLARLLKALARRYPIQHVDRPLRHRAGPQDRSRASLRLVAAAPVDRAASLTGIRARPVRPAAHPGAPSRAVRGRGIMDGYAAACGLFSRCILFFVAFKWQGIFFATSCRDRRIDRPDRVSCAGSAAASPSSIGCRSRSSSMFGGATLVLQDEAFIKWKPTVLYALFGAILAGGRLFFGRNLLAHLMAGITLPEPDLVAPDLVVGRRSSRSWASPTGTSRSTIRPRPGSTSRSGAASGCSSPSRSPRACSSRGTCGEEAP